LPARGANLRRVLAACSKCGEQHVLRESDLGAHARVQFRCSKCGEATVVEVSRRPDATIVMSPLPSFARSELAGSSVRVPPANDGLTLPEKFNVVLTLEAGPAAGTKHVLRKARVVLGRQGADIAVNDPEVSRHHCLLEVRENYINLKDMDSTNGTFYEEERVRAAMLTDGAEFRVGNTIIRVSFQPK